MVGESIWKILETHSNKTNSILKVLKPDCTYQVKVQVHCLTKIYNTNDFVTLRTPEGCKQSYLFSLDSLGLQIVDQVTPACDS